MACILTSAVGKLEAEVYRNKSDYLQDLQTRIWECHYGKTKRQVATVTKILCGYNGI
jgi:hypothetical protein